MKRMKMSLQWLPWIAVGVVLFTRAPLWWKNYRLEGEHVTVGTQGQAGTLAEALRAPTRKILIFWASWCGPCEIELGRFAAAVRSGELPASAVIAVSTDQDPQAYARAVAERKYPFRVFLDREGLAGRLGVELTPTVLHLQPDQTVAYATAGVSPLAIWRAKRFLAP